MEKCCVDSHFIRKIQCFAAYEAVLRSEFPTAESFIRMCAKDGLSRTTLGFEESNKPAVSHILACVLSLALRLAEQGKLESETTELIQRFGLELVSHLKMSPTPLAVITLFGNLIILVALLGHGLSLSEQVSLDQNQRGQVKEVALAITAAVRGYAWRASRKIFFRLCCIALADVTRLVYGGRCKQAESALSALMRRRDSRMPEHICLMLEARLLRLRRLNDGKDSVAAHVPNLLKRFESFDNRCDPDRLRMLFQVDG
ncbi:hypothetical protein DFJ73DRAFT_390576 [Zopfochytrium polystomum]|nr:hypothetical protein DFJ73DRAFT_390576 [Zopfochytrium polystomum]